MPSAKLVGPVCTFVLLGALALVFVAYEILLSSTISFYDTRSEAVAAFSCANVVTVNDTVEECTTVINLDSAAYTDAQVAAFKDDDTVASVYMHRAVLFSSWWVWLTSYHYLSLVIIVAALSTAVKLSVSRKSPVKSCLTITNCALSFGVFVFVFIATIVISVNGCYPGSSCRHCPFCFDPERPLYGEGRASYEWLYWMLWVMVALAGLLVFVIVAVMISDSSLVSKVRSRKQRLLKERNSDSDSSQRIEIL